MLRLMPGFMRIVSGELVSNQRTMVAPCPTHWPMPTTACPRSGLRSLATKASNRGSSSDGAAVVMGRNLAHPICQQPEVVAPLGAAHQASNRPFAARW